MTPLPDWLVERTALDEVPDASRGRIDAADPRELAQRVAALNDDNASELAAYPAGPALTQIKARLAIRRTARRRQLQRTVLGVATSAVALVIAVRIVGHHGDEQPRPVVTDDDGVRAKGKARLVAYRQVGDHAERLEEDALCRAGDVIQLRYNAGGKHYGVIASVDGAGVVTLHFPASEDAPPDATAVSPQTTALPHAYELDDAPRFERFFFLTSNEPIDLQQSLGALRALARSDEAADAPLDLPLEVRQWSLRLRKPDSTNHEVRP
jgi:hypothetical protein